MRIYRVTPTEQRRDYTIATYVTRTEREGLIQAAQRRGITVAELVRRAVLPEVGAGSRAPTLKG